MTMFEYVHEVRTQLQKLFNDNVIVVVTETPFTSFLIAYRDYHVRVSTSEAEVFYRNVAPSSECAKEIARIIMREFGRILLNDDVRNSGYL